MATTPHKTQTANADDNLLRRHPWVLRLPMAIGLLALMGVLGRRVPGLGPAIIYLSGWVIVPHVFLGVWVFVRHLKATTPAHTVLDTLAFCFLCFGVLSFRSTAAWCAWFGAVFTLAIVKYVMVTQTDIAPELKRYAREKILLESPAVLLFFLAAFTTFRLPEDAAMHRVLELAILLSSAGFAVYMIFVRRAYHKVVKAAKEAA